jgi:starch synthase (maltosyl-transferring)
LALVTLSQTQVERIPAGAAEREAGDTVPDRVVIENVWPEIDAGRHPAKRVVGEFLQVYADIFADGHDRLGAALRYRAADEPHWHEAPMEPMDNDRWTGSFAVGRLVDYVYTVQGWIDPFASWLNETVKKRDAGQDIGLDLREGLELVTAALERASALDRDRIEPLIAGLKHQPAKTDAELEQLLLSTEIREFMGRWGERRSASQHARELCLLVDRPAARYSAWYELFPRSQSPVPGKHGTFDDVIGRLDYVRSLGFDVLYFPPIHPIGRTNRKGRNNSLIAQPGDPGSPYAIGSAEGGHTALHPELGTFEDFRRLVRAAAEHGLEIALDFAIQCSLDHPWIRQHPEWFDWRSDGTIKFAENPPKKYEDIVNVNFQRGYPMAWHALRDVVLFWIDQGVRIFRVDNPHTKPLAFWEWMIADVRRRHPDAIFLAEAFTRPKMMRRLAKLGFNQSYTYFTWRNTKAELTAYLTELAQGEMAEYYRPNFFVNTPDINPVPLQTSGRPGFVIRATLAATMSPSYGIYSGFELCEAAPLPGREEYLDSEKYEIRQRDWDQPGNIRDHIARLNRIRQDNPALHDLRNLRFYNAEDDHIIVYGKMTRARDNAILVAVNLDPHNARGCHFEIPLWEFGLSDHASVQAEELLTGQSYPWYGKRQHIWLDPRRNPAAIWRITPPGRIR